MTPLACTNHEEVSAGLGSCSALTLHVRPGTVELCLTVLSPEGCRKIKLDDQVAAPHIKALLNDICGYNGVGFSATKSVKTCMSH